jgi:hypothetical protein
MPAQFKDHDDQYFTYESAKEVKERNGQYVVYDAYGSVLGVHLVSSIELFTSDPLRVQSPDQD